MKSIGNDRVNEIYNTSEEIPAPDAGDREWREYIMTKYTSTPKLKSKSQIIANKSEDLMRFHDDVKEENCSNGNGDFFSDFGL